MNVLRLTIQPRECPSWMEKDIGHLTIQNADTMKKVAMALAAEPGRPLSYVRVYDGADICILTASPAAWAVGYQESLR